MYSHYFTCAHDGLHLQLALVVFSYANECITVLMCRNAYVCMGVHCNLHTVVVVVFCCAYLAVCVLVCVFIGGEGELMSTPPHGNPGQCL